MASCSSLDLRGSCSRKPWLSVQQLSGPQHSSDDRGAATLFVARAESKAGPKLGLCPAAEDFAEQGALLAEASRPLTDERMAVILCRKLPALRGTVATPHRFGVFGAGFLCAKV